MKAGNDRNKSWIEKAYLQCSSIIGRSDVKYSSTPIFSSVIESILEFLNYPKRHTLFEPSDEHATDIGEI